ncbi:MAG: CoA-binding protein [Micrococcus sp.]|nr:CoA-binding protein [Micrococcus sp.]
MSTVLPERTWTGPTAPQRLDILRRTRSIAIVGASDKPARASYFVATYLLSSTSFDVYFINPILAESGGTILGHQVYASLADLPVTPDLVEVFRKASDAPGVVEDAHAAGAKTVWLQLGIWNEEAAELAEGYGMNVVMDRCVKIEHARFHGGLNLAGFVTGVVSSKRQTIDRH